MPKVEELKTGGMRLAATRTKVKDVVYIAGSVLGGRNMLPAEKRSVNALRAELLDTGTKSRTKEEIRDTLSSLGATLSFSGGGDRLFFDASCLPEDVDTVLTLLAECLREPAFPAKELELARKRELAAYEEAKTETGTQASIAIDRILFEKGHPGYCLSTEEGIKSAKKVTRADLVAFHKKTGREGLYFVIGGDIDTKKALALAAKRLGTLPKGSYAPTKMPEPRRLKRQEALISIPDKATVDVYLSTRVLIRSDDKRFLPFKVLLSLLGGGGVSTGHLMRTVRERDGLTYGIRAYATDFADFADGAFTVSATFAPKVFKKGVEVTRKEIAAFFASGITSSRFKAKQEELLGRYLMSLSTTGGVVGNLHGIMLDKKELSYLRGYVKELEALTLFQVKAARELVPLKELSLAAAGTFAK